MPELADFPPPDHLGRDLHIAYRLPAPDRIDLRIPVVPELLRPDGTISSEVLATVLDETTGFVSVFACLPDWGSTAALAMGFTLEPVEPRGELVVDGRIVKAGRRLVFVEAEARWEGRLVAHAEGQFARVGRADRNLDMAMPDPDPDQTFALGLPGSGLDRPYADRLGLRVVDGPAGAVELAFDGYTRNSSGILHGGVVGALALAGAEAAAGAPASAAQVQYLSPGRVGPFRTRAELRYEQATGRVWRVDTIDGGDDDRAMTRAVVTTRGGASS